MNQSPLTIGEVVVFVFVLLYFWVSYFMRSAQSAGPGSEKGPLLELIFAWLLVYVWSSFWDSESSFVSFLAHFAIIEHTFRELEANFVITKAVWTTKGAPRGIAPNVLSFLETHFGAVFGICRLFEYCL